VFKRWLAYWFGAGDDHQYQFYRCTLCQRIVTWRQIRQGGCKCMSSRVRPAELTLMEKGRALLLPWTL
jgi:hypothetical protein